MRMSSPRLKSRSFIFPERRPIVESAWSRTRAGRRTAAFLGLALIAILAGGCAASGATPSASASASATATGTAGASTTPGPTPTALATSTMAPTATPSSAAAPLPRAAWTHGQTVKAYSLVTAGVGWVYTNHGVWETNDDGTTWANATPAHIIVSKIRGLGGLDASDAMIAAVDVFPGHSTYYIWRTSNGGRSWSYVALPNIPNEVPSTPCASGDFCGQPGDPPATFDFVDTNTAFVTILMRQGTDGYTAYTYETTTGGQTWTARTYIPTLSSIGFPGATRVQFSSPSTGVAEVGGEMASTTAGWGHWTVRLLDESYFSDSSVYFLGSNQWFADGSLENGSVTYHYEVSTDHGAVWTPETSSVPGLIGLIGASVQFLSATEWIGTCDTLPSPGVYGRPTTIYTVDSGAHWALEGQQPFVGSAPVFADSNHGWTGPAGQITGVGVYSTSDRGVHWHLITP
jgi:hypothetical protein